MKESNVFYIGIIILLLVTGYGFLNMETTSVRAEEAKIFQCEITAPEHLSEYGKKVCAELLLAKKNKN